MLGTKRLEIFGRANGQVSMSMDVYAHLAQDTQGKVRASTALAAFWASRGSRLPL